jgi:L,D-peptidoglycan transpeptidase YkuD (ErfK/YbiS/YcfS/YnhG family)
VKKKIFISGFILIIVSVSFLFIVKFWPKPPVEEIKTAREVLSESKSAKSDIYCPQYYTIANRNYNRAMKYWKNENNKFVFKRNYDSISFFAKKTIEYGRKAKTESLLVSAGLKWHIRNQLDSINNQKKYFQDIFHKLPLPVNIQRQNTRGFLLLDEAEISYNNQNYRQSEERLIAAKESISVSYDYAFNKLNDYFLNTKTWQEMAKSTIEKSRRNKSTAIIVDKFSRQCMLYNSGKLKYTFSVELGSNWMTDKQLKGDKATPEGNYSIIRKIKQPNTKYYKALLINYPNEKDLKKFEKAKKQKLIPRNADIGGLIEIHGHGNQGADWTNGCIALKNEDMDIIYREAIEETVVTIVGSLKPINEILNMPDEHENKHD